MVRPPCGSPRRLGTWVERPRLRGLEVPSFRSPPGISEVQRSIKRRGQSATVAVRLRGRPWAAVVSDMIEGIVVANGLTGAKADMARSALWLVVEPATHAAA